MIMKTKLFFIAVLAVVLAGCNNNEPEVLNGKIVGTMGCCDEATRTIFYKGYFVETSNKDTVLSFNLDVQDSIYVEYGTRVIQPPIQIPYSFTLTVLEPGDPRYVHYAPIVEDAYHPHITTGNEIQVIINPLKK